jgi:hypothetical protein
LLKIRQPCLASAAGKSRLDATTDYGTGQPRIEPDGGPRKQPPSRKLENPINRDGEYRSDR